MTRPGWFVAVFAPAVAVAAAAWPLGTRSPGVAGTAVEPVEVATARPDVGRAVGQGGCASAGCHGAPAGSAFRDGPGPSSWASSAILWAAADPHQRAYDVLTENHMGTAGLATRMMIALTGEASAGVPKVKATADARCLACHTNPALATTTDDHGRMLQAQGVSCEACHGNAGGWLQAHTGFTPDTRAAGYATGRMAKLYDLGERALACAGCHVGAPAGNGLPLRDMNHGMIAAGHPRLNFDFATYQAMLPKHWHEHDRTKPGTAPDPNFEARAWLVGRVAHAEAACLLTADRARRADPWPEFAESSCVACHHAVVGEKTAYPSPTGRKPGSLPWQPIWPLTRSADFAGLDPGPAAGALSALLAAMQRPRPAAGAGEAAKAAARDLGAFRQRLTAMPGAAALAGRTIARAGAIPDGEWDRDLTEQVFHALAARERSRLARGEKTDPVGFAAAAKVLTLPRGTVRYFVPENADEAVRVLAK